MPRKASLSLLFFSFCMSAAAPDATRRDASAHRRTPYDNQISPDAFKMSMQGTKSFSRLLSEALCVAVLQCCCCLRPGELIRLTSSTWCTGWKLRSSWDITTHLSIRLASKRERERKGERDRAAESNTKLGGSCLLMCVCACLQNVANNTTAAALLSNWGWGRFVWKCKKLNIINE